MFRSVKVLLVVAILSSTMPLILGSTTVANAPSSPTATKFVDFDLPPSSTSWPHKPVFVQAGHDMDVSFDKDTPLPLGIPFDFESDVFKGQLLVRFRNVKSDDAKKHTNYFEGRKRLMQIVMQGKFKKRINMSEVYTGSLFSQPFRFAPPPAMVRVIDAIIRRVAPGVVLDLASKKPKVIALLAGTVQTLSIDKPGEEPDITLPDIPENVTSQLGEKLGASIQKRRKTLSIPKKAAKYDYDPEHVYTFQTYDDAVDYGRGILRIPMYGEYDIKPYIGPQPLSWSAVTADGEALYNFDIWHEQTMASVESTA